MPAPFLTRSATVSARESSWDRDTASSTSTIQAYQLDRQNSFPEDVRPMPPSASAGRRPRSRNGGSGPTTSALRDSSYKIENQEQTIRNLQDQVERLTSELKSRDYSNNNNNSSNNFVSDKASEAKLREMEQLRNSARAAEFALRGQEEEMKAMKKRIFELEKMTGDSGQRSSSRLEISDLTAELRGKEAELKEKIRQCQEKERKIKDLESKLLCVPAGNDRQSGDLEQQIVALEDKLRNKEQDLRDLERLRSSERHLKERASQLANKVHELEDQLRARNIEIKSVKDTAASSEKQVGEVGTLMAKITKLEGECKEWSLKCASMEKNLSTMKMAMESAENEKNSVSGARDAARDAAEKTRKELMESRNLVVELQGQLRSAQEDIDGNKALLSKGKDREQELVNHVQQLTNELTSLRYGASNMSDREAQHLQLQAQLESQLSKIREAAESSAKAAKCAESCASSWEEKCIKSRAEADSLKLELENANKMIESLKSHMDGKTHAEAKLLEMQKRMEAAEKEVLTSVDCAKRATEEANKAIAEAKQSQVQSEALKNELVGLKEVLRITEQAKEAAVKEGAMHDSIAKRLQTELECVRKIQAETEKQLNAMAASLKALESQRLLSSSSQSSLDEVKGECSKLQQELEQHKQKEVVWNHQKQIYDTKSQISRLQTLLRMAEITKLEEILKATKRVEAVREELIGLLNYNLSAAEGQNLRSNADAVNKQVKTREERLEALHKKAKVEEEKIKQAEQTYQTQTKRLKEKLQTLEEELKKLQEANPSAAAATL